jgi:hypothetical protein
LVTQANGVEGELHQPHDCITDVTNAHTWMMGWQWCHFLLASNTRKVQPGIVYVKSCETENITYCPCQIMLDRKLSCKFEKWCKFSSHIKSKSFKKKLYKVVQIWPGLIFV